MAKSIFSASWYRVAGLKPRLRSHAQIHRHQYRGETWFVLQELAKERLFRFSPAAYFAIGLMQGQTSVHQIWETTCARLADDAPTQDDMIQLLSQLYQADVLQCDVSPDAAELLKRSEEQTRRERQGRLFSLFSWRFSLLDPDRFLEKFLPLARVIFSAFGGIVWLAAVVPAVVLFVSHWTDLTTDVLDRVFIPENFLILWLVFPLIKICHEFGHAFAAKVFGGEVHDMGVMLLVLAPVPYVDASSASAFREKWRRVIVGAAGMLLELFIASLALFIWLNAEPGLVRTLAFNAVFIAGVSTVLFNGNPLLRYDGYYILSDFLEIPNLRARSMAYLTYISERYLFGNVQAERPDASASERTWFVVFGILAFVYRVLLVVAILLYVATRLLNVGAIIAFAAFIVWTVVPVSKGLKFLFTNPQLRLVRGRAITVTAIILAVVAGFIGFVPLPYRTGTEGVIWIPEESFVRAETEGVVQNLDVPSGNRVEDKTPLITLVNPFLIKQEKVLAARLQELEARHIQFLSSDPVKAQMAVDAARQEKDRLARIREDIAGLSVRSGTHGTFIVPSPEDLPGRFLHKGDVLGYVLELQRVTVRTIVSQESIDMVRNRTYGVAVRLSERLQEMVPATVKRVVPGASEQLPAKALGVAGGGAIAIDPTDRQGLKAVKKVFQIDLEMPAHSQRVNLGGRAYVRFDHGHAPLAAQWYFQVRQLFLSRFNV
jgi:putative peptide zinc metalloprotease protein